ncbi:MAG: AMIN-like domain-containing (lipo)protein [Ilumatobacteraceae bacterium]
MTSTSTIVPATTPATAAVTTPATAPPTSSPTTPPTTAACPVFTDTDVKAPGFPGKLSGLVGADVRTGIQPCSERFVLELQGTGDFPGWWVRYQAAPLTDDPRGEPVQVAGAAFIVVTVESWMTNMEGDGYHGPTRITPTNVSHIKELVMLGNFESVTTWAIGLDSQRPFRVTTLDAPPRLVIDISVA